MTCVFDSLLIGIRDIEPSISDINNLLEHIQKSFKLPCEVIWNDSKISDNEQISSLEALKSIKISHQGYDMSCCDPLLIAYCSVFNVNIVNIFDGYQMKYNIQHPRKTIHLHSSKTHMTYISSQ